MPHIALIDNYDSYTYNLHQLLWEVSGCRPRVFHHDEERVESLLAGGFTHFVISPGPGTPEEPSDFGLCRELIRRVRVPCLGVCLGHQGIASVFGGRITSTPMVMHGRRSQIRHHGDGLFTGIPRPFPAVRYHSLMAARPLPDELIETAWSDDGVIMGLAHRSRPLYGIQFHPESVETQYGARLIANFLGIADGAAAAAPTSAAVIDLAPRRRPSPRPATAETVHWRRLECPISPETVFAEMYADEPYSFWLDSADHVHGTGRYSFMGAAGERIVRGYAGAGVVEVSSEAGPQCHAGSIIEYLRTQPATPTECPLPFTGGFVGYLGYGTKGDLGIGRAGRGPQPDAELMRVSRFIAFDHVEGCVYVVATDISGDEADAWLERTCARVRSLARGARRPPHRPATVSGVRATVDRATYREHFGEIQRWLTAGQSYEACYTYQLRAHGNGDPLGVYLRLRAESPAPYAAFLRFGDRRVLSSSPERFLRVDPDGRAESKPIKGTAARNADPAWDARLRRSLVRDEKTRSENLMIVDLIRNDLGRVCRPGTVHVARLMGVESYATVHQLVSTVRGRLRPELSGADALAALFPGGSMTGAPKKRTVELLDQLEVSDRGVYSGCLGYLGSNGAIDMGIVIRTIVWEGDQLTMGVGGAITAMSQPDDEYAETRLKALALLRALGVAPDNTRSLKPLGDTRPAGRRV